MKNILFYLFMMFLSQSLKPQSLSTSRVAKIKDATVRVTIEGTDIVGTGFFIKSDGTLLTCWHVVAASQMIPNKKIFIELKSGEILEAQINPIILTDTDLYKQIISYDFCELSVVNNKNRKFKFLNIGNYNTLNEGQAIYTCGYPIGIPQQVISQGIVSTKYKEDRYIYRNGKITNEVYHRLQSYADITLNKGNSGGAIVSVGSSIDKDVVVGIADFILVPFGQKVDSLYNQVSGSQSDFEMDGISEMKSFQLFSVALSFASNGVSGFVSINHYKDAVQSLSKK